MSTTNGDLAGVQPCTVPLGKSLRRALRAAIAIGMQKPKPKDKAKKKKKKAQPPPPCAGGASVELSRSSSVAARKEAVVRVVMKGGVVEVYPGVVLACTVIRKHPPGLCLAHPDVFRNPHGAVVRPLEPLFPGQKFLLIPETTLVRLKRQIPESSIGAFADEDYDDDDEAEDVEDGEEVAAASSSDEFSSGGGAVSSPEDEVTAECSARDYFVAKDRWSELRFKQLVEQGLAVAPSRDDDEPPERKQQDKARNKKLGGSSKKKRKGRRRRGRPLPLPVGLRGFATARRTWEPSLPSVEEEEDATVDVSPLHPPSESESRLEEIAPQDHHVQ